MCDRPITLPNGQKTACRKCMQCRQRTINDWVGRCIAEQKTAKAANVVTLTYGQGHHGDADHERAAILTYSDVQKFLKLLRRHGYPVRYFSAGEYGSKKGRAHWHVILYWQDEAPEVEIRQNIHYKHWPHGFSFWDTLNEKTASYVTKYVAKSMGDGEQQGHIAMSKQPPLGAKYFAQLADITASQGLAPQTLEYTFPGVSWTANGVREPRRFRLHGKSAELYLQAYVDSWRRHWGDRHMPNSEVVEEFLDPSAWKNKQGDLGPLQLQEVEPVTEADKERRRAVLNRYGEAANLPDEEWERGIWAAQDAIRSIFGE